MNANNILTWSDLAVRLVEKLNNMDIENIEWFRSKLTALMGADGVDQEDIECINKVIDLIIEQKQEGEST